MACSADVHIITPEGRSRGTFVDSVFTVHSLASPIGVRAEIRRDLIVEGLSRTNGSGPLSMSRELTELVDRDLTAPWLGGAEILAELRPDLAVIIDHRSVGALDVLDQHDNELPMLLLALGVAPHSVGFHVFQSSSGEPGPFWPSPNRSATSSPNIMGERRRSERSVPP